MATVDDGDGAHTLQVVVRLAKVEAPPKTKAVAPAPEPVNTTFLTAKERKAMRKAALAAEAALAAAQTAAAMATFHRPDVRVGDTLRVVGRVDEWARRRHGREEWVRQVFVDEASGSGSLSEADGENRSADAQVLSTPTSSSVTRPRSPPCTRHCTRTRSPCRQPRHRWPGLRRGQRPTRRSPHLPSRRSPVYRQAMCTTTTSPQSPNHVSPIQPS